MLTYIVNDTLAIDAACLGCLTPLDRQRRIRHVLLTHSHADHIATLPLLLDNVYAQGPDCVVLHGSEATLETLQRDVFNDRVWPDFVRLSTDNSPFVRLEPIVDGQTVTIEGLQITPVALDHVVPTLGFVVDDGSSAVAFVSDTSPTTRIWEVASQAARLKAVFLEASFPNEMEWLANASMHLTPRMFAEELKKLRRSVRVIAVHIKPAHHESVVRELAELRLPLLEVGVPDTEYRF